MAACGNDLSIDSGCSVTGAVVISPGSRLTGIELMQQLQYLSLRSSFEIIDYNTDKYLFAHL